MDQDRDFQSSGNVLVNAIKSVDKYTHTGHKRKIIGMIVLIFLSAVMDVVGLAAVIPLIKAGTDPAVIQSNQYFSAVYDYFGFTDNRYFILFLIGLLVAYFLFKTAFGIFVNWLQARLTSDIAVYITNGQFSKYYMLEYLDFSGIKSSILLRNILYNPTSYVQWIIHPLTTIVSETIIVILVVTAIAWYDLFLFGFILVTIGPATYLVYRAMKRKGTRIGIGIDQVFPHVLSSLNESIHGYIDIKLAGKTEKYKSRFLRHTKNYQELLQSMSLMSQIPLRTNEMIALFGIIMIFLYALFLSEYETDIVVLVGAFAAAAYRLMPSMNRLLNSVNYINNNQVSIYNLNLYEDLIKPDVTSQNSQPVLFNESIELKHISFQFPGTGKKVLSDLSITVKKGEKIGLVGSSGSGKSTIMNLLLRFFHENSGEILVDGKKLTNDQIVSWRNLIGYVKQDIFLIDGSIRENITLDDSQPDVNRLRNAIRQASLEDLVNSRPEGVESRIGEKGSQLSGGQRQRIGIARSLYRNAEILIFDEATSALDSATELEVSKAIDSLSEIHKTVFIIAHRITTLKNCDRIYELKDGQVSGIYTYQELIAKSL